MVQVMTPTAGVDTAGLHAALDERVDGEVRFDPGTLSAYAQDASNYRQVPIGVVVPRRRERGHVPELPGHPRGGAFHPGPVPAADGDGAR